MMVRYNQLNTIRYNRVGKVRYNDRADLVPVVPSFYDRLAKARPVILDEDRKVLAVLENARDTIISEEINGEHTLTFTLPFNDSKRQYIRNERYVRVVDREYVIRRVNIIRPESGSISVEVYCEATWYELKYSEPMTGVTEWVNETPRTVMQAILAGTGWSLGEVEITTRRDFSVDEQLTNRLSALWEVPEIWGGELEFDTDKRIIHLRKQIGGDPGVAILTGKNMRSMESEISTEELATRLYPYGENKLTIKDVNQGREYVENFQYTDKVKVKIFHDERFTNPFHLKEKAEEILSEISKPRESYIVKASDLSFQTGLSHETFKLGDRITTYDKDLGVFIKTRIVRWEYNVVKPWETDLELSAKSPDLRDLLDHVKDVAGQEVPLSDTWLEYINIPYQPTVAIRFNQAYTLPPSVNVNILRNTNTPNQGGSLGGLNMTPNVDLIIESVDDILKYTGAVITWGGSPPSSIPDGYVSVQVIGRV